MKKIKVLHFELLDKVGGIESFLLNLVKCNDYSKIQMDFISTKQNPAFKKEFESYGANVFTIPPYKKFKACKNAIRKILLNDYDVVHIHKNSAANILPIKYVKKYSNAKIIVHSHNTSPSKSGFVFQLLHLINRKYLRKNTDIKIAGSFETAEWLYGKNANYVMIKNGIYVDDYKYSEDIRVNKRSELEISSDTFVIGHVGKFTKQKNHEYLVELFSNIHSKNANTLLLLIGVGDLQEYIKKMVVDKGLENVVLFLNQRSDIKELLSVMDVFVFPSLYEGVSVATIEAQASGLPCFFSEGVNKESFILDSTEVFSLEDNVDNVSNSILKYYGKEMKEQRLLSNSIVSERGYNVKNTSKKLLDLYVELGDKK